MSYIIGSFNIRDFNYANKSDDGEEIDRDFNKIAEIIVREKFDVIALQEVNSESALNYLVKNLNTKYKSIEREYAYIYGEDMPNPKGSIDKEKYAFIWNTKRLRLVKTRSNNPGFFQSAYALKILRPPYYARFTARGMRNGANFELRLINIHLYFGSMRKEDMAIRKMEFNNIINDVLPRMCDKPEVSEEGEIMPFYTFLMGDYNLEMQQIYRVETRIKYRGKSREFKTIQDKKTSLKKASNQITIEDCYSSNYDHFTYEVEMDNKLILVPQRVEALSRYFSNEPTTVDKLNSYRKKVSDHVPIKLIVDFKYIQERNKYE